MSNATSGSETALINAPGNNIPYCGCIQRIKASALDKAPVLV